MVRALAEATRQGAEMARQMTLPYGIVRLNGDPIPMLCPLHQPTWPNYPLYPGGENAVERQRRFFRMPRFSAWAWRCRRRHKAPPTARSQGSATRKVSNGPDRHLVQVALSCRAPGAGKIARAPPHRLARGWCRWMVPVDGASDFQKGRRTTSPRRRCQTARVPDASWSIPAAPAQISDAVSPRQRQSESPPWAFPR